MGVAIRYLSRLLNEVEAKLPITLSDGKRDDYFDICRWLTTQPSRPRVRPSDKKPTPRKVSKPSRPYGIWQKRQFCLDSIKPSFEPARLDNRGNIVQN